VKRTPLDYATMDALIRSQVKTSDIVRQMGCAHSSVSHRRKKLHLPAPPQQRGRRGTNASDDPLRTIAYAAAVESAFRKIHSEYYPEIPYEHFRQLASVGSLPNKLQGHIRKWTMERQGWAAKLFHI
jgi:hypothetical protein